MRWNRSVEVEAWFLLFSEPVRAAPAMWPSIALYQAGESKRWMIVTLQRSRREGERVGSWVAIRRRVPRWRCWRTMERRVSVNSTASVDVVDRNWWMLVISHLVTGSYGSLLTLCASSNATMRPALPRPSKKREMQMLNNAQASSGPMNGQLKSTMVKVPFLKSQMSSICCCCCCCCCACPPFWCFGGLTVSGLKNDSSTSNLSFRAMFWVPMNSAFSSLCLKTR